MCEQGSVIDRDGRGVILGDADVPILSVSPWLIVGVGSRVTEWLRRRTSPDIEWSGRLRLGSELFVHACGWGVARGRRIDRQR
jgi:hypothetical protein